MTNQKGGPDWFEYIEETSGKKNNMETTQRGFKIFKFSDRYGKKCSIQESSIAEEPCLWVGIDDPKIKIGPPWEEVTEEQILNAFGGSWFLIESRMHLTISQAKDLIKQLQWFIENHYQMK